MRHDPRAYPLGHVGKPSQFASGYHPPPGHRPPRPPRTAAQKVAKVLTVCLRIVVDVVIAIGFLAACRLAWTFGQSMHWIN